MFCSVHVQTDMGEKLYLAHVLTSISNTSIAGYFLVTRLLRGICRRSTDNSLRSLKVLLMSTEEFIEVITSAIELFAPLCPVF